MITKWTDTDLITTCAQRPPVETAWQEFVRRYHPLIRKYVLKAVQVVQPEPPPVNGTVEILVEEVYRKLVEGNGQALKLVRGLDDMHISQFLLLISVKVAQNHFRRAAS